MNLRNFLGKSIKAAAGLLGALLLLPRARRGEASDVVYDLGDAPIPYGHDYGMRNGDTDLAIAEAIVATIWDETGPINWEKLKRLDPNENWDMIRHQTMPAPSEKYRSPGTFRERLRDLNNK